MRGGVEVFSIAVSIVTLTAVCAFLTEMEEQVSCLGDLSNRDITSCDNKQQNKDHPRRPA